MFFNYSYVVTAFDVMNVWKPHKANTNIANKIARTPQTAARGYANNALPTISMLVKC